MMKKIAIALVPLVLASTALAEEPAASTKSRPTHTSLKVSVVLSRHQGDKRVASLPYTLFAATDERPTHLRMGIDVPIYVEGKDAKIQYKTVGTSIDCGAMAPEDGRYRLNLTVEQSSVYSADGRSDAVPKAENPATPLFRTFVTSFNLLLRDGQTAQYATATDPISGEVLKLDVTLEVLK
jgi:hypothetical protein